MKQCLFDIMPRQSGKTTDLIEKANHFKDLDYSVVFITMNEAMVYSLQNTYEISRGIKLYSATSFLDHHLTFDCKRDQYDYVMIDEYLMMPIETQEKLYNSIRPLVKDIVYIKSSPVKMYNKKVIDFIVDWKTLHEKHYEICDQFKLLWRDSSRNFLKEYDELYFNFLTDPKTSLYSRYAAVSKICSKERFETEYMGKFFKEV